MTNLKVRFFMLAALLCGVFFLVTSGGATTGGNNSTTVKNEAPQSNETLITDETPVESVGVKKCDEYIKKYEACLMKIAKDAPQVQPSLKTAFEQQREAFKQAAANPEAKAALKSSCKQAIKMAKKSTTNYKCEW